MGYNGFVKLSANILQSSIMLESPETFKCWITILASCDSDGIARISPVFLMSVCHLDKETVLKSLNVLESPDQLSRSQAEDGRRIKRIDGGYQIINYHKYRDWTYSSNPDSVRKKSLRDRKKAEAGHVPENTENAGHVRTPLSSVICTLSSSSDNTYKESDSKGDINTSSDNSTSSDSKRESIRESNRRVEEQANQIYSFYPKKKDKGHALLAIKKALKKCDFETLLEKVKKYAESVIGKDQQFIPYPATWFNGVRWEDQEDSKIVQQAVGQQQTISAPDEGLYAAEKRYDSGRCRRYIDAMLRRLLPKDDAWEKYIIPETDEELKPIWEIIVADGGYINGVKTKEAATKIFGMLKEYP